VAFPAQPVLSFAVRLVPGYFGDAYAVLFARADAYGPAVLDEYDRVAGNAALYGPAEQHVGQFRFRRLALYGIVFAFVIALGGNEIRGAAYARRKRKLHDAAAVQQGAEIQVADGSIARQIRDFWQAHDAEIFFCGKHFQRTRAEVRSRDNFAITFGYCFGGFKVDDPVGYHGPAECRDPVGKIGMLIRFGYGRTHGDTGRIIVLHDGAGRFVHKIAENRQSAVHVGEIGLARMLAELQQLS